VSQPEQPKECGSETISFATFILSLFTAGLQQLGVQANETVAPSAGAPPGDLCLARQTIDLLEMLEHKTQGNLTPDESKLLTNILFDLRMHYVQAAKGTKP
jgi:Domain of unknown function (DUF1844).